MFIKINKGDIEKSLEGNNRQYIVGNLKKPQKLTYLPTDELEIGITDYDEYTTEEPHYHTTVTEYQYMLEGRTKYLDVSSGKEFTFEKGDFYAIETNTVYAQKSYPGTRILFIKSVSINDKVPIDASEDVICWMNRK